MAGLLPKYVIIENVPGMTSVEDGIAVKEIKSGLKSLGYEVEVKLLKAENYGVAQERRRLIFIGNRVGQEIEFPQHTHGDGLLPFVTVWDVISDLPKLENGEGSEVMNYSIPPQSDYQKLIRDGFPNDFQSCCASVGRYQFRKIKVYSRGRKLARYSY